MRKVCGEKDLWKRQSFSLEWNSDEVMENGTGDGEDDKLACVMIRGDSEGTESQDAGEIKQEVKMMQIETWRAIYHLCETVTVGYNWPVG